MGKSKLSTVEPAPNFNSHFVWHDQRCPGGEDSDRPGRVLHVRPAVLRLPGHCVERRQEALHEEAAAGRLRDAHRAGERGRHHRDRRAHDHPVRVADRRLLLLDPRPHVPDLHRSRHLLGQGLRPLPLEGRQELPRHHGGHPRAHLRQQVGHRGHRGPLLRTTWQRHARRDPAAKRQSERHQRLSLISIVRHAELICIKDVDGNFFKCT